ncbi:MAG: hypothetical protein A3I04_06505 [Nitrospinae bacterium RIFCSPLOWO2_02_FULL_39_110]|nr:MAG: hypothetical protein A3I04_06505 [Nitrospinae bacterium RIFCSPLOWO2_02_FULL_39_110]OGW08625.1 MAG: hypothetical protein A3F81_00265 [Nitrospinae bacterium RIFCSPLOWO2_12_FULL_39_93]OGW09622.1 MAG: hypothetical protein A2W75_01895 [Nitrospinae bacterium RIFCSPLOWO2_12_39_15]
MKFIVDLTMGRLARWLRIAGYNTVLYNSEKMDGIIEIASKEERVILTRNNILVERNKKLLKEKGIQYLLLTADIVERQLQDTATYFGLNLKENSFTFCINCNTPLTSIPKEETAGKVPDYVHQNYNKFVRCEKCGKIFWGGTHKKRMEERLAKFQG